MLSRTRPHTWGQKPSLHDLIWKDSQKLMSGDPMILKDIWIPQDVLKTILKKSLEFLRTHTSTNDPNRLRVATAKILCSWSVSEWFISKSQASGRRKHKAFMSKLWEDYERLMSGYPIIGKGVRTPQDRWKATPEEVRHWNSSGHIACELNLCCWYTKLKECHRNRGAHRLWVVHERFMRGLWVAHE